MVEKHDRIQELRQEIEELRASLPAHSVPASQLMRLERRNLKDKPPGPPVRAVSTAVQSMADLPTSVHVGESPEEVTLLRTGGGPWRDRLRALGAWREDWTAPGCGPGDYLLDLGVVGPRTLVIHGVQLGEAELARVAASHGGRYTSHVRSEDRRFWEAIDEILVIGREAGLQVQISHVKLALRNATDAAHQLGVFGVPTIAIDGELFWGDDRLSDAAAVAATRLR